MQRKLDCTFDWGYFHGMPMANSVAIRRLPVVPTRCRGESFASWIDRLADGLKISRTDAWKATGLLASNEQLPHAYGVRLSQTAAANLVDSTGVRDATDMLLAHYDGGAVEIGALSRHWTAATWARTYWVFVGNSGLCPDCLVESDGIWQLAWKTAWTFGCATHRRFLTYRCPRCGSHWQSNARDVRQRKLCCRHVRRAYGHVRSAFDEICGYPASQAPTLPLESPRTIALLERVGCLLDPAADLPLPDGLTRRAAFNYLLDMARTVLHIATPASFPEDLDIASKAAVAAHIEHREIEGPRRGEEALAGVRAYRLPPTNGPLVAAVLRVAAPIVLSGDAGEDVDHFLSTALATRAGKRRWVELRRYWKPPERLAPYFRTASHSALFPLGVALDGRSHHTRSPAKPGVVTARHVPQVLWPEIHLQLSDGIECLRGGSELANRRFTAMALVRQIDPTVTTWDRAAAALDFPAEYAAIGHQRTPKLRHDMRGHEFSRRLEALHNAMASDARLIDYAHRRHALAGLVGIPGRQWATVLRESGMTPPSGAQRLPRLAAAWIWCEATCGDYHLAPALGRLVSTASERKLEYKAYTSFLARYLPRMEQQLRDLVSEILATRHLPGDVAHEPDLVSA